MISPWFVTPSIPASGTEWCKGMIPLVKARTLSITVREIFNGSGTTDSTVYLYYSPDGSNFDTIAYTSFAVTVSAGNTVQRTALIDVPEHGYIKVSIANEDSTYTVTSVQLWYGIQSWEHYGVFHKGSIQSDSGEEGELSRYPYRR